MKKAKQSSKVMAPVSVTTLENLEHAETSVPLWPMLSSSKTVKPRPYRAPIIPTSNKFEAFESEVDDDDDDEEAIMQSLNALTSNVNLASDKSRSLNAKRKRPEPLTIVYLTMIAPMV